MTASAKKLQQEALSLPLSDRASLARALLLSLEEEDDDSGAEEAWDAELATRLTDVESGRAEGRPADLVLAELEARLR